MKDIVITSQRIKTEIVWMAGAFIVANLCNAWAIWKYGASFKELFTSIFYVLTFAIFIYIVTAIVRLLLSLAKNKILRKK